MGLQMIVSVCVTIVFQKFYHVYMLGPAKTRENQRIMNM